MSIKGNDISDETLITEVTIAPDGRIYVFGTSRQILDVLESLQPDDAIVQRLLQRVREPETNKAQHHE
jgi:hypothetical protein